jgi:UDP-glucose 4-epimerase
MKTLPQNQSSNASAILITGGCGFIGVNLIKYLGNLGYKIRVLDNLSVGRKENLLDAGCLLASDSLIIGDIRDQEALSQNIKGVDAIVHLAAHTRVVESLSKPQETWDINTKGTFNLLEACRLTGVKTFIFASTNAALGEQTPPFNETKIPKPISPYGASKLAGEALCTSYSHSYGLNTVILRIGNSYGPHSKHKASVIAKFIKRAIQNEPLAIYGDGKQTRDFIHVNDVCQAINLCLTTTKSISGEIFHIASGRETTINELTNMILEISGKKIEIVHEPKQKGEVERNYSSIAKATKVLGFKPKIALRNGLIDLWNWYTGAIT